MPRRHLLLTGALSLLVLVTFLEIFSRVLPANLRGALFQRNPTVIPPTTGIFLFQGYEAQPNERGSILIEAAENFQDFEALSFTFAVDSAAAEVVRVRRTAVTQNFEISVHFSAPGVVHVALVGEPRRILQGQSLLEVELQLADNTVNTVGARIDLRLIDTVYLTDSTQLRETSHDGLITILTNQNALTLPFAPFIADIEPNVYPLVQHRSLLIRGRALPAFPRVLLGSRPIPVLSASETEILAMIPEETLPGSAAVSVESLLADEKVVVFDAVGPSGSVDILDELLFMSPNPVLYNAQNRSPEVVLWVPIHNPIGPSDPVIGSVDLSVIGGDPNIIFSGVGTPALGPGGTTVNWFRVPSTGTVRLPDDLETNVDYPIAVRVENRTQTRDSTVELLQLRSQIPQGRAPFFGSVEIVPSAPVPGDTITFYADVTDQEGIETVERVSVRLTPLRGSFQELQPVLSIPTGDAPLSTMTFTTSFAIPGSVVPGVYSLQFSARDEDGNESGTVFFPLIVSAPGAMPVGSPPQFSGRLEARPEVVRPGNDVDFFASVRDPDGTQTIDIVSIDLISIGGGIVEMSATLQTPSIGTLPVVYETSFILPTNVAAGTYNLTVRAVDINGLEATTTIPLTVDTASSGGQGSPPQFSGRLEASPGTVPVGGEVSFFVSVRDLEGSDTIAQVTIDLVNIRGSILPLSPAVAPVPGSAQPVIYTGEFTVPNSVAPGVYSLTVSAVDEDGNLSLTTLPLTVSVTAQQGSVPRILQLFSTPSAVAADGESDVSFTVEVEDSDGIEDIEVVRISLTPLDLGIEFLNRSSQGGSSLRGIFTSRNIRIPRSVRPAVYDLQVEVEDKGGNRVQRMLRLNVGQQQRGGSPPEIRDARFVPEVGRPGKSVDLFVEVRDANGTEELTVVADLTDLRGSVEELDALINFPSGTVATQNTFRVENIDIPEDLAPGVYDISITAIDDTGNIVIGGARLRVERGGEEDGQPPSITVSRSFQSPRVFPNDGETKGEMHVLVHDADDDVVTVIANLGSLGYANSASRRDGVGDIELLCNESRSIVCMQPGVPEGQTDRWFILKDVTIPETTLPSTDPYPLLLTAIDAEGNTVKETIPLLIGGPDTAEKLTVPPQFLTIVPVDEDEFELLVSAPIDTRTVERGGTQFLLQPTLDALATARIVRVSWDTTGKLLYLQTNALTPGETYTLTVAPLQGGTKPLTDVHGNRFSKDNGGSIIFKAYTRTGLAPKIERVHSIDATHLDVRFALQVIPSSVHPDLLSSRILLQSTTSGEEVPVRGGVLRDNARTLRLSIDPLREGDRYRLRIDGVLAPGLITVPPPGAETLFIAVFPKEGADAGPLVLPTADLNGDLRVDFADFALFSAVYGTEYALPQEEDVSSPLRTSSPTPPPPRFGSPPPGQGFGGDLPPVEIPGL